MNAGSTYMVKHIQKGLALLHSENYAASLEAEGITDIMKFGYAFFARKSAICKAA